jgi:SulP family sulfate permease
MNLPDMPGIKPPQVERTTLVADLLAGLTFAAVNIPQGMANALLAGVNPVLGLYTLFIATPVGAIFTSSVFMNVSTTSALSVAAGDTLSSVPAAARPANLVILVLLMGLFQILAGAFRLGTLVRFVSNAVMVGFISGVAALIVLGQVNDFFGYDSSFNNKVLQLADTLLNLNKVYWPAVIVGSLTIALILLLNRTRASKYGMIIALVITTLLAWIWSPEALALVGDIATLGGEGGLLENITLPDFRYAPAMVSSALALAIIGLVQGAGVSQSYPNPDGRYPDVSRDFLGQGMANAATSVFQGIPAGGSMSGTAVTVNAGARTRLANIFGGILVAPLVFLLDDFINLIPLSALAGLLIYVGFNSFKPEDVRTVWQTGRISSAAMILTFASTLVMPLQFAVFVGVAVSIMLYVVQSSGGLRAMRLVPVEEGFPIEEELPERLPDNEIVIIQLYGELFFAAATTLEDYLPDPGDSQNTVVVLRLRGRDDIGSTLIGVLLRIHENLEKDGGHLILAGISEPVYEQLRRTGALQTIGYGYIFRAEKQLGVSTNKAIAAGREFLEKKEPKE